MQHKPTITVISVAGLPQPIVRALQAAVSLLHRTLPHRRRVSRQLDLLTKPGRVTGPIDRLHIYEDVG